VVHEEAAAFALDALDREEVEAFRQHLATCPDCDATLEELRFAAAALAFAGDLPRPPEHLRSRVTDVGAPVIPLRRRIRPELLSVAAAVAACLVIAVLLHFWTGSGTVGGLERHAAAGGGATLLVGDSREAVLVVPHLPRPPAGKVYEVWVIERGRTASAGILRGSLLQLTRRVPRGAAVAVSIEPTGGSPHPTGPLLLRAETT
jgi:Anti-sigma-K factor rskA/Putative zinc-finger